MTDAMCIMVAAAASIVFAILVFRAPEPGPSRFCAENRMTFVKIADGIATCSNFDGSIHRFDNFGRRL